MTRKIKTISSMIGLVVAIAFSFSFIYNFAYFWTLNISLVDVPLSTQDIVNTALFWMPTVAIAFGVNYVIHLFIRRKEHGMTEEEIVANSENSEKTRKQHEMPEKFFKWTLWLGLGLFVILGQEVFTSTFIIFVGFSVFWLSICVWFFSHPRIKEKKSPSLILAIFVFPIVVGMFFTLGYESARNRVSNTGSYASVYVKNQDEKTKFALIRTLENGVLIRALDKESFDFLPWSEVIKIERNYAVKRFRGILCEWSGICLSSYLAKKK